MNNDTIAVGISRFGALARQNEYKKTAGDTPNDTTSESESIFFPNSYSSTLLVLRATHPSIESKSNENISDYIRKLIMSIQIKEKPDYEFYEVMKQLSKIGVNLNQIAHKANAINIIDKDYYNQEAKKWNEFSREVKKKYL